MTQRHWLEITEYIAIATSMGGTFATIITQQVIFSITPLTITLLLNTINRQREFSYIRKLPEHSQLLETYNDLIAVNEDYRFHKLEVQEAIKKFEHNQALLKLLLEKLKDAYQADIYDLNHKINQLYSNSNKSKIDELNQLSVSFNKRLNYVERMINLQQNNSINTQDSASHNSTYPPSVSSKYRTERINTKNQEIKEYSNSDDAFNIKKIEEINNLFQGLEKEFKNVFKQ